MQCLSREDIAGSSKVLAVMMTGTKLDPVLIFEVHACCLIEST